MLQGGILIPMLLCKHLLHNLAVFPASASVCSVMGKGLSGLFRLFSLFGPFRRGERVCLVYPVCLDNAVYFVDFVCFVYFVREERVYPVYPVYPVCSGWSIRSVRSEDRELGIGELGN